MIMLCPDADVVLFCSVNQRAGLGFGLWKIKCSGKWLAIHTLCSDPVVSNSNSGIAYLLFLSAEFLLQYPDSSRQFCVGLFCIIGMCCSYTDVGWIYTELQRKRLSSKILF